VIKVVSILGCGWLGQALAQTLLSKGYVVRGSATSQENGNKLKALGVDPYKITLENNEIFGDINSFISGTDILITAIPPGLRKNPEANYAMRIQQLLTIVTNHPNCKVLHLSSIGVFGDAQGSVDENSKPNPDTLVGEQLMQAESSVLSLKNKATLVRLGGLVGKGRHPVKQLAGKQNIPAPYAQTNLVHQNDVIAFLAEIIERNLWGHILHCVSPLHHERAAFYTQECLNNNFPIPSFSSTKSARTKKVDDTKSEALFAFQYQLVECRLKDC